MIEEAFAANSRRFKVYSVLEINVLTLQHWEKSLPEDKDLGEPLKTFTIGWPGRGQSLRFLERLLINGHENYSDKHRNGGVKNLHNQTSAPGSFL